MVVPKAKWEVSMRKRVLRDVLSLMSLVIVLEAVINIISGYVAIIIGATIEGFANSALNGRANDVKKSIWILIAVLLVTIVVIPAIDYFVKVTMFKQSLKHDRMIISNFMDKAYDRSFAYTSGDISYRLEMDPVNLRWLIIHGCTLSSEIIVVSIGLLYMIFKINTTYAVACLLVGLGPVLVAFISGKLENKYELSKKEYEGKVRGLQTDICFNFLFIKLYNLKNSMINRFSKLFSAYYENTIKKYINCKASVEFFNKVFKTLAEIIILVLGAYLVSKGIIEAGGVAAMMIYLAKVQDIYTKIGTLIKKLILLPQCLDRVSDLYAHKETSGHIEIKGFKNLVCENLSFGFDDNSKIFKGVSLTLNKGEKLAIKGDNGSGKSTLIKVLSGLYGDYEGKVKINNHNFKEINLKSLRDSISYMEQDPFVFKGTVYDNVAVGNLKASKEEVERCIEHAGLTDLKDKETETLGNNLSGGEKQRISIARAMIRDKDLIFMDEPFNNLDAKGRELIEEILQDKEKTIVYITHDLELLRYGDGVLEM